MGPEREILTSFSVAYLSNWAVYDREVQKQSGDLTILHFSQFPIKEALEILSQKQQDGNLESLIYADRDRCTKSNSPKGTYEGMFEKGMALLSCANKKYPPRVSQISFKFDHIGEFQSRIAYNELPIAGEFFSTTPFIVHDPKFSTKTVAEVSQDIFDMISDKKSEAQKEYEKGSDLSKVQAVFKMAMDSKNEVEFRKQEMPKGWNFGNI